MAKITWLGEDIGEQAGPSFTTWNGIKFPKGKAVEVTNEHMIGKARGNRFFKVAEAKAPEKEPDAKTPETTAPLLQTTKAESVNIEATAPEPPKAKSGYAPAKKKVRKPATAHHRAHR